MRGDIASGSDAVDVRICKFLTLNQRTFCRLAILIMLQAYEAAPPLAAPFSYFHFYEKIIVKKQKPRCLSSPRFYCRW